MHRLAAASFLLLVLLFVPTAAIAQELSFPQPLAGPPILAAPAGFEDLDEPWRSALAAVVAAETAYLPAPSPYTVTAFDTYTDAAGEWALAVIVPSTVVEEGWESLELDLLVDVLLLRTPDGAVEGHVRASPAYLDLARRTPKQLVDYSPLFATGPSAQARALDYRFPWTAGQTWWSGGGWHTGYGPDALDFGPLTDLNPPVNSAVLASAQGTLRMACQNDEEQRLLWIEHPGGERTGYLHLDRGSVRSAVEDRNLVGQAVLQGTYLGTVYRGEAKLDGKCPDKFPACTFNTICGYGSAPHVHFLAPNRSITLDGIPVDAIGAGQASDRFTSTNTRRDDGADTQPPDAWLTVPLTTSLFVTPTRGAISVTLGALDASGVLSAAVQLAWQDADGQWQASPWQQALPGGELGGESKVHSGGQSGGAATFSTQLATCGGGAQIPHNSALRLSLSLADKVGNWVQIDQTGDFRLAFPDLDADCTLGLRDLLDLRHALADGATPPLDHDVDGSGGVDDADVDALLALLLDGAAGSPLFAQSVTPAGGSSGDSAAESVAGSAGTSADNSSAGRWAFATDWRSGNLALVELPGAGQAGSSPRPPIVRRLTSLGNRIYGVAAANGFAYVADAADAGGRLLVLKAPLGAAGAGDASLAPSVLLTPTLAFSLPLGGELTHAAVISDLLLVSGGSAGLHLLDVRTPQTPTLLATYTMSGGVVSAAGALVLPAVPQVSAPRTIAAIAGRDAGLQFVDLRDPAAPAPLASFATQGPALGVTLATTPSVQGAAAIAYVAEGVSGVEIVALGAKDQPRRLAALPASSAAAALVLDGSTLYVAGGWEGVLAYDVSDPANPRLLGTHAVEGYAYDVQVAGDLLLVAAGTGGLQALLLADLRGRAHRLMLPFLSAAPPR